MPEKVVPEAKKRLKGENPETGEILLTECARRLGLTPQGLGQLAKQPGAPARYEGANVWVQWPQFARWREKELIAKAVAAVAPSAHDDAKARRETAAAEREEIALAKERGDAISIADSEAAIERVYDLVRVRLLAASVKIAPLVASGEDVSRLRTALSGYMKQLLRELQEDESDVLPEDAAA